MKTAQEQIPEILSAARGHLVKLSSANVKLAQERDAACHELHAIKVAMRMDERGLDQNLTVAEKIAGLRGLSPEKLSSLEQAVELAAGGVSLTKLSEADAEPSTPNRNELDDFVLNNGFTA